MNWSHCQASDIRRGGCPRLRGRLEKIVQVRNGRSAGRAASGNVVVGRAESDIVSGALLSGLGPVSSTGRRGVAISEVEARQPGLDVGEAEVRANLRPQAGPSVASWRPSTPGAGYEANCVAWRPPDILRVGACASLRGLEPATFGQVHVRLGENSQRISVIEPRPFHDTLAALGCAIGWSLIGRSDRQGNLCHGSVRQIPLMITLPAKWIPNAVVASI